MGFRYNGRTAWLWFAISAGNAGLAWVRMHRHGWRPDFGVLQFIIWVLMSAFWLANCSLRWSFEAEALKQTRLGIFVRCIPYSEIVSIEQLGTGDAIRIHYGGISMFTQPATLTVQPNHLFAFLEQLDHRVPSLSQT